MTWFATQVLQKKKQFFMSYKLGFVYLKELEFGNDMLVKQYLRLLLVNLICWPPKFGNTTEPKLYIKNES
jgi:hypothetical protein